MHKVKVDFFLGFIGSGKSRIINELIKKDLDNKRLVVVQCEIGKTIINKSENIFLELYNGEINKDYIKLLCDKYNPEEIIIEFNGINNIDECLNNLKTDYYKDDYIINNIFTIVSSKDINMYIRNMYNKFYKHILYGQKIIINNYENANKEEIKSIKKQIKVINEISKVYVINSFLNIDNKNINIADEKQSLSNKNIFYILTFIMLAFYLMILIPYIKKYNSELVSNSIFSKVSVIFISLVIESTPFILFGSLLPSIFQNFNIINKIKNIKIKNNTVKIIMSSFIGFFMPVCDCGTVPLLKGFIKSGMSKGQAVTFMLSAPIVNPICILSTWYAFSEMRYMVILRILISEIVAVSTGIIIDKYENIKMVANEGVYCNCFIYGTESNSIYNKIKGVFLQSADDFVNTMRYVIIGALLSSILQSFITVNNISVSNVVIQVLIMIGAAFLISNCSTSDAFIGRSFLSNFTAPSVLGFLVFGPMIDIKNFILLINSLNKAFVLKLILIVFTLTFSLILITQIIFIII